MKSFLQIFCFSVAGRPEGHHRPPLLPPTPAPLPGTPLPLPERGLFVPQHLRPFRWAPFLLLLLLHLHLLLPFFLFRIQSEDCLCLNIYAPSGEPLLRNSFYNSSKFIKTNLKYLKRNPIGKPIGCLYLNIYAPFGEPLFAPLFLDFFSILEKKLKLLGALIH